MSKLSFTDAAYIAGIIDGEGSIMLYNHRTQVTLRVSVGNTHRGLLAWLQETTGYGSVVNQAEATAKHKAIYHWRANPTQSADLLEQIRPYLLVKTRQADLAIDFQRRLLTEKKEKEWQEDYRQRMSALNKRGPKEA